MAKSAIDVSLNMTLNAQSLNAATKEVRQSLGRITGNASEFQKSLDASTARVFAFGASTFVIEGVKQAFSALVSTTIEVEKRLIEIKSIFGGTANEFNQFRESIFQVAKNTGQSFSVVADAAAEFARQGLDAAETAKRLEAALILTRVSGLDSVKAVSALTAAINGFSSAGLSAAQITNKLIAVDTKFAVSAKDLAEGFSRAGSTAEDAGVSFDELLGIITAVQQTTSRGGAVIGNALKSIFTRLSRSSTIEDLQGLGVAIDSSQTGIQKLQALSNALDQISDPSKASQIKELAGGVYQINIVSAALKDLSKETSIFSRATAISAGATNEALQKNNDLNKSLAAQLNSLVIGFTNLAEKIGQITFAPLLGTLAGLATKVSDFFNEALDPEKGNAFVQGLLKSIGSFLSGPGLVLITTAFLKIITLVARYAKEGFASILSIGTQTEKLKSIQEGLVNSLINDKKFREDILSSTLTLEQKQKAVGDAIARENALLREQQAILTTLSKQALNLGVSGFSKEKGFTGKSGKPIAARGYIPNYAASAQETMMETSAAREHGYKAGKVYNTRLYDGTGGSFKSTVNSAETIKTVRGPNGKLGTYVIPPNGFAGKGFVPNYVGPAAAIRAAGIKSLNDLEKYRVAGKNSFQIGGTIIPLSQAKNVLGRTSTQETNARGQERLIMDGGQFGMLIPNIKALGSVNQFLGTLDTSKGKVPYNLSNLAIRGPQVPNAVDQAANPDDEKLKESIYKTVSNKAASFANLLRGQKVSSSDIRSSLEQNSGAIGALNSAVGAAFESAVLSAYPSQFFDKQANKIGGDFDLRNPSEDVRTLFALDAARTKLDFKASDSKFSKDSMAKKIYNENYKNKVPSTLGKRGAASGFIPNFAVDLNKSQDYVKNQRKRNFKASTYRKATGTIGSLFKSLPEKFFADGVLGDGAQGLETNGIFNLIKQNALYGASFAGPKAIKFVTEAEKYGLKVEKSLKDKLAKLVVKGASKMKGFAGGFLPNFANPLQDALGREMAAGVPASQIYVDSSARLRNSNNPMGLMVANSIDEPKGGYQGINRAVKEGKNPRKYGAAGGFVPNYAKGGSGLSGGIGNLQIAFFALSTVSNTLLASNNELNDTIQKVITGLSTLLILQSLASPLKGVVGTFTKFPKLFSSLGKNISKFGLLKAPIAALSAPLLGLVAVAGTLLAIGITFKTLQSKINKSLEESLNINKRVASERKKRISEGEIALRGTGASDTSGIVERSNQEVDRVKKLNDLQVELDKTGSGFIDSFLESGILFTDIKFDATASTQAKRKEIQKKIEELEKQGEETWGQYSNDIDAIKKAQIKLQKNNEQVQQIALQKTSSGRYASSILGVASQLKTDKSSLEAKRSGLTEELQTSKKSATKDETVEEKNKRLKNESRIKEEISSLDKDIKATSSALADSFNQFNQVIEYSSENYDKAFEDAISSFKKSASLLSSTLEETAKFLMQRGQSLDIASSLTPASGKSSEILAKQLQIASGKNQAQTSRNEFKQSILDFGKNLNNLDVLKVSNAPQEERERQIAEFKSLNARIKPDSTVGEDGLTVKQRSEVERSFASNKASAEGFSLLQGSEDIKKLEKDLTTGKFDQNIFNDFFSGGEKALKDTLQKSFSSVDFEKDQGKELFNKAKESAIAYRDNLIKGYTEARNIQTQINNDIKANGLELVAAQKQALSELPNVLKQIREGEKVDPTALFNKFQEAAKLLKTGDPKDARKANEILASTSGESERFKALFGQQALEGIQQRSGLTPDIISKSVSTASLDKIDYSSIEDIIRTKFSVGSDEALRSLNKVKVDPTKLQDFLNTINRITSGGSAKLKEAGADITGSLGGLSKGKIGAPSVREVNQSLRSELSSASKEQLVGLDSTLKAFVKDSSNVEIFKKLEEQLKQTLGAEKGSKFASAYKDATKQGEFTGEDAEVSKLTEKRNQLAVEIDAVNKQVQDFKTAFDKTKITASIDQLAEVVNSASANIISFSELTRKIDQIGTILNNNPLFGTAVSQ